MEKAVITVLGNDRVGIIHNVTRVLVDCGLVNVSTGCTRALTGNATGQSNRESHTGNN